MTKVHSRISALVVVCACAQVVPALIYGASDEQLGQIKAQLKAQIDAEVGALKTDYEGRIKTLEERINALEADNAKLRSGSQTARQAQAQPAPNPPPATADQEIAALRERIADLEQARSERRDEMSGTGSEIAALKQRVAELEGVATKAQTEVMPAMSEREAANEEAIRRNARPTRTPTCRMTHEHHENSRL